jgi:hypothetical protein
VILGWVPQHSLERTLAGVERRVEKRAWEKKILPCLS